MAAATADDCFCSVDGPCYISHWRSEHRLVAVVPSHGLGSTWTRYLAWSILTPWRSMDYIRDCKACRGSSKNTLFRPIGELYLWADSYLLYASQAIPNRADGILRLLDACGARTGVPCRIEVKGSLSTYKGLDRFVVVKLASYIFAWMPYCSNFRSLDKSQSISGQCLQMWPARFL